VKKNQVVQGVKLKGADKVARIPIKVVPSKNVQRKPPWIRAKAPTGDRVKQLKARLRENSLYTVCEEASCPNLGECFSKGTATFMIMGDICTRRCPFCDVGHGRPNPLDDGGAAHFVECIQQTRKLNPEIQIEILTPDFRGRMDVALQIMTQAPPDVFNHNLESVPSLYKKIRPGSDYEWSLDLLQQFKQLHPQVPTKSGLMLGLGEEIDEVKQVLRDMRAHDVNMLTLGQYLQPSLDHLAVERFVTPEEFDELGAYAESIGFDQVASGPMVRSSYHADLQAEAVLNS
jgi:lipoic acid synthetase